MPLSAHLGEECFFLNQSHPCLDLGGSNDIVVTYNREGLALLQLGKQTLNGCRWLPWGIDDFSDIH